MEWFQQLNAPEKQRESQQNPRILSFPVSDQGARPTTMRYMGPVPLDANGEPDFAELRRREESVSSARSLCSAPSTSDDVPDLSSLHLRNRRRDRDRAMRKHHKPTWGQIKALSNQAEEVLKRQNVAPTAENLLIAAFSCLSINSLDHFDHDYCRSRPR